MTAPERLRAALSDRYQIERELGVGSMATVYLAVDVKHRRKVAVKVLKSDLAAALGADRFLREIDIAAQLEHPHILTLIDSGQADGFLYYVMPFVDGESVRDRLSAEDKIPIDEVIDILCDLSEALLYAHEHGVVHRDVKPDNIMVAGGNAVVTDFGLAKAVQVSGSRNMTQAGIALGTPPYMAPEQAMGDPGMNHRADIYAVGCVGYELLAGRPPFIGASAQMIIAGHITELPKPVTERRPGVPRALANIVMKCLEKKPEDRYQTTEELLVQLRTLRSSSGAILATSAVPVVARRKRGVLATVVAAVAVIVVALAAWFVTGMERGGTAEDGGVRSLAVLPFVDLSADRDQEYLGDGIAETLIAALSRMEGFRVAARTSAFSFKDRNEDVRTIGRELGVSAVLEGTVQRSGTRLRITAQLVDSEDGFHIWSQTYDRNLDDVFAVQDEVARAVVSALRGDFVAEAGGAIDMGGTGNVGAYDAYLRGRAAWNERTGEALARAATDFRRAIEADSFYALAWSGLADAYVLMPQYDPDLMPLDSALDRAQRAARRAIALDATLADPHATLGMVFQTRLAVNEAQRAYETAVRLNPNYPTGHHWYATYLIAMDRPAEAVEQMRQAAELDPLSHIIALWYALALDADGQPVAAEEQFERTLALDPDVWSVHRHAWVHHLRRSNFEQAGVHLARMIALAGEPIATAQEWRRRVTDPASRPGTLRTVIDSLLPALIATSPDATAWGLKPLTAEVLVLLGDTARALATLEQASDTEIDPVPLHTFVLNPALREHPRFLALLERRGPR